MYYHFLLVNFFFYMIFDFYFNNYPRWLCSDALFSHLSKEKGENELCRKKITPVLTQRSTEKKRYAKSSIFPSRITMEGRISFSLVLQVSLLLTTKPTPCSSHSAGITNFGVFFRRPGRLGPSSSFFSFVFFFVLLYCCGVSRA